MARLTTRTPWTRQPQFATGLKPRSDLAVAWAYGDNFRSGSEGLFDLVRGGRAPFADGNNKFSSAVTRNGVAGSNGGAAPSSLSYDLTSNALNGLTRMSLMVWFEFDGADTSIQWLNFRNDLQHSIDVFSQTATSITWGSDWTGAWNGASQQTLSGLKTGDLVCLVATIGQTGARLFHNGVFSGAKSGSGFTTSSSLIKVVSSTRAKILGGAAFSSTLPDGEAIALSANPWQLFAPQTRTLWVPASAGGGSSVSSDSAQTYQSAATISADIAQVYTAFQTVAADVLQTYVANQVAQADTSQSYQAGGQVSSDSAQTYAAGNTVTTDTAQTYSAASQVDSDSSQIYQSLNTVAADLAQAYTTAMYVSADTGQSYTTFETVLKDDTQSYSAHKSVVSDSLQSYVASETGSTKVSSDILQSYEAIGRVSADIAQTYVGNVTVSFDSAQIYAALSTVDTTLAQTYSASESIARETEQTYSALAQVSASTAQTYSALGEGGLSLQHAAWLEALARANGLIDTLTVSATHRSDGTLVQSITEVGNSVTLTTTSAPSGAAGTSSLTTNQSTWLERLVRHHGIIAPLTVTDTGESDGVLRLSTTTNAGVTTVELV